MMIGQREKRPDGACCGMVGQSERLVSRSAMPRILRNPRVRSTIGLVASHRISHCVQVWNRPFSSVRNAVRGTSNPCLERLPLRFGWSTQRE